MTNLLPLHVQKQIASEYKRRRTIIILSACIVTIILSAGFLVPSYILSTVKRSEVRNAVAQARSTIEDFEKTKSEASILLKDAEKKLALLGTTDVASHPSDVMRVVTDTKGPYIRLQSITFETGKGDGVGNMVVAGIAKDRDSLTGFVKQLESEKLFSKVDLPVSNFAKDKDIMFSLHIEGIF